MLDKQHPFVPSIQIPTPWRSPINGGVILTTYIRRHYITNANNPLLMGNPSDSP